MGDPADGEKVDARFRDGTGRFRRDGSRGFGDCTASDASDRFFELRGIHIVEQDLVDPDLEGFVELGECVDFHFELGALGNSGARRLNGRRHAAGRGGGVRGAGEP